jgi:hypothetical protein
VLTPEVARKIKELADAGIPIIGKKFSTSPSLQNYPACDAEVRAISDQLQKDGSLMDLPINQLFNKKGILPDFITKEQEVLWVHRKTKDADIYFISNQLDSTRFLNCTFRVTGKQPEIWDAATGNIKNAGSFEIKDGLTQLPLKLDPSGSCFVIFRKAVPSKNGTSSLNWPVYVQIQELSNPWIVSFDAKWGGPEKVIFPTLQDWSKNELKGIRYYSGTANYETQFDLREVPESLSIDLGNVKNLAEVTLNGISLGVLWKPPFITNISKAVKPGKNTLVVKVTNLWANRLIGDEQEPADLKWDTKLAGLSSVKNAMAGYKLMEMPSWFTEGKPRPSSGRFTFTTFNYFTKDSPLLESGLIGPVKLLSEE